MATFICMDAPPTIPLRRSTGKAAVPCELPQHRPFTVEGFAGGGRRFSRLSLAATRSRVAPNGIHYAGQDAETIWYEVKA